MERLFNLQIPSKPFRVVNVVFFQCAWFICVIGGNDSLFWLVPLIGLHFCLSPSPINDLRAGVTIASLGIVIDSVFVWSSLFSFNSSFIPLWLCALWFTFGLSLNHCFHWFGSQKITVQVIAGALGGSASYFSGYLLSSVQFPQGVAVTLFIVGLAWAAALPTFYRLLKELNYE